MHKNGSFPTYKDALQFSSSVIINEVDTDTPGTDAAEFIELYDGGLGNTSLTGLVLVAFNGSDDRSYNLGGYSNAIDLDGYSTDANGYFLIGNSNIAGVDISFANGSLQNGADALALYLGDGTDFPNDTPLTTTNLIDAIVYDTDDGDDAGLLTLLNDGQIQVNEDAGGSAISPTVSLQRCPNGTGGKRNTATYEQYAPTPGTMNCVPEIDVQRPADTSIADNETDSQGNKNPGEQVTLTYTIKNTGVKTLNISNITTANTNNVNIGTITPTNLTVASGGGTATFDLPYTPVAGSGTFSFEIDIANNDPDEGNYDISVSGTRDDVAPTVTINQASGQTDPTNTSPISFDVAFSENVSGFDNTDINISGMTGVPSITINGTNDTYTVEITGMVDGETITATIPVNAAQDAVGNNSLASTSTIIASPTIQQASISLAAALSENQTTPPFKT